MLYSVCYGSALRDIDMNAVLSVLRDTITITILSIIIITSFIIILLSALRDIDTMNAVLSALRDIDINAVLSVLGQCVMGL